MDAETTAIDDLDGQRSITSIHSIAVASGDDDPLVFTSQPTHYSDGALLEAVEMINNHKYMVGHNSSLFDRPVLESKLGVKLLPKDLDTLILSKLTFTKNMLFDIDRDLGWFEPNSPNKGLLGSYSLEAFGARIAEADSWYVLDMSNCTQTEQDEIERLINVRVN